MTHNAKVAGLDGVVVGETAISTLDAGLHYRGYAIEELAREASFTEVAYLLLHGELPTPEQLADFRAILAEAAEVPEPVIQLLHELPLHIAPIDALRTSISALGHFDPQANESDETANLGKAIRLLGQIPVLIAARHRLTRGLELFESDPELSFAGNFWSLLNGRWPTGRDERALETALICYADHEFNASSFTARIVASTGSDLHSAVTAAVGALKGPRHGGAIENVLEVLLSIGSPSRAEKFVRDAIAQKWRVAGFGHRVYRDRPDPRAVLLKEVCRELASTEERQTIEEIADAVEAAMWKHKELRPNVDWPTARLYHFLGLDAELFTPLFVAARVVGWAAHVREQQAENRLIQPRSKYVGPKPRKFVSLRNRG
ncbi:MAG TPA: citrate/2-methylcitrate synthase [Planctomycetaceae bacterium]|nr:citrate/2-methylcitrate synthase [Planctomycetaceae bacterium]